MSEFKGQTMSELGREMGWGVEFDRAEVLATLTDAEVLEVVIKYQLMDRVGHIAVEREENACLWHAHRRALILGGWTYHPATADRVGGTWVNAEGVDIIDYYWTSKYGRKR
jgi:hypothetical protein